MKWTIKTRLLAGCGVLVLVLAVACVLGWNQAASAEQRIGGIIKNNQADIARLETVQGAIADVHATARAEKEFLLRKELSFAQTVTNKLGKIEAGLGSLAVAAGTAEHQLVTNALALAAAYGTAFNTMTELLVKRGLTQNEGLEGQLRAAVHSVEGMVTNLGIAELDVLLLKCRRHEKDYLLRGNTNYLKDIATRIDEFKQQMVQFSMPEPTQTNAAAAWQTYFQGMQSIVATDALIKVAGQECQQAAEQFGQQMNELSRSTSEAIGASQKSALTMMASGKYFMLILLAVGVIVGTGVAVLLIRAITRPILAIAESLADGANHTVAASSQVAAASQTLAEGASEQAASLEETSASLEELTSMVKRNAEAASQAKVLANETRSAADTGAADMQEMKVAMRDIKSSSDEVAKIVKSIDEIAFQTNILALNAAVEAARAGEAGAGFAVVADEVRNLAQRSAGAAKETADKIEVAIAKSVRGVQIGDKVAGGLEQIVGKIREVDKYVQQIAIASNEQAQGVSQVNIAVSQMDKLTQANAASSEESASAAEELNAQAESVKELAGNLQQLVERQQRETKSDGNHPATRSESRAKRELSDAQRSKGTPGPASPQGSVRRNAGEPLVVATGGSRKDLPMPGDGEFKEF